MFFQSGNYKDSPSALEFPPREGSDTKSPPPVDIVDPWEGPSTYAEDFYSGGDVPFGAADAHLLPTEVYDVQDEGL